MCVFTYIYIHAWVMCVYIYIYICVWCVGNLNASEHAPPTRCCVFQKCIMCCLYVLSCVLFCECLYVCCVYIYVCDVCVYIYTYTYMWCSGNLDASEALSLYKVHIFIHTYTYIHKRREVCLLFWLLLLLHVCARVCMFLCVHCCDASELLGWAVCKFDSRTIKRKRARDGGCMVGRAHAASCASHITPSCAQHTIELRQIT